MFQDETDVLLDRWLVQPRAGTGVARVDEEGITLGSERIPRETMRSAVFVSGVPTDLGRVVIHGERGAPLVTVRAAEDMGARILSVLRVDTLAFEGEWPAGSVWWDAKPVIGFVALVLGVITTGYLGVGLVGAFLAWKLWGLLTSARILVARDGIAVAWLLGSRRRFIPWGSVGALHRVRSGVEQAVLLPAGKEMQGTLLSRMEAAWAAYQAVQAGDVGARLARGGRDRARR